VRGSAADPGSDPEAVSALEELREGREMAASNPRIEQLFSAASFLRFVPQKQRVH